jgi:pilus assembly protein CpaB
MNRQTRTLIVLLVAVAAASVASWGVYRAVARIPVREVEIATRHTVVAASTLPLGAMLTRDNVKLVAWPAQTPLAGGFDNIEAVVDRGLITPVAENEPLTESKLAPKEAGAGLSPTIPQGMRAMSVRVNEVIGVAGFVVPGTRVDVLVTIREQNNNSHTQVVLDNVQVLSAGTRYDIENARQDGQAIPSTVVTLLVSPEDAERITLAQNAGQIMLALRNPLDTDPSETEGVRLAGLFGQPQRPAAAPAPVRIAAARPAPAAPPPPPASTPLVYTVEAIRGAQRTQETVR